MPGNIASYIRHFILKDDDWYEKQTDGFAKVREILGQGEQTPSQNAADIVLELIKEKK